jgi:hypothetical protein
LVGDVTKWYQSHGFNTEPGWAMKVEVEEKVSEKIVVEMDKIEVQSPVFDTEPELGHISGYGIKISEKIVVEKDKI